MAELSEGQIILQLYLVVSTTVDLRIKQDQMKISLMSWWLLWNTDLCTRKFVFEDTSNETTGKSVKCWLKNPAFYFRDLSIVTNPHANVFDML